MPDFQLLEPAITPKDTVGFLLDWELTMKCNLDCSYCGTGLYSGHMNSLPHPELEKSLKTIDFMYEYVDMYMSLKPRWARKVVLNIYGGEALYYPKIDEIVSEVKTRYEPYKDNWNLHVTTTTNLILSRKQLEKIYESVDEFTASFHSESSAAQQKLFRDNLLFLSEKGKKVKVIILMHPGSPNWQHCIEMIDFCRVNDINNLPRQLDHDISDTQFNYTDEQTQWFKEFYNKRTFGDIDLEKPILKDNNNNNDLSQYGRSCCGGRQLCLNNEYKQRKGFVVGNNFQDWYCTVNWFFLFIKQVNGEVYTNKDCKMNLDSQVAPLGSLDDTDKMLSDLRARIEGKNLPVIKCAKTKCKCGLCAPKSVDRDRLLAAFKKYTITDVFSG